MRRWWLVAGAGVVVAGAAAAGVFFALRGGGSSEGPASLNADAQWWQDLLRFVPATNDYLNAELYLANRQAVARKFGVEAERVQMCDLALNRQFSEDVWGRLSQIDLRVPPPDDAASTLSPQLQKTVGFTACDIGELAAAHISLDRDLSVYRVGVPDSQIQAALISAGYEQRTAAGANVFSNPDDSQGTPATTPDAARIRVELFRSRFERVVLTGTAMLRTRDPQSMDEALAAGRGGDKSALTRQGLGDLVATLGEFDAAVVVPTHHARGEPRAIPDLDQLVAGATPPADLAATFGRTPIPKYDWDTLTPPDRVVVAYLRKDGGDDVLKVALYYANAGFADRNAGELRHRLETYVSFLTRKPFCDRVEVNTQALKSGASVVATCTGGLAGNWNQAFLSGDFLFLAQRANPGQ